MRKFSELACYFTILNVPVLQIQWDELLPLTETALTLYDKLIFKIYTYIFLKISDTAYLQIKC